ncbi:MAG: adenylosuccinate synthase [Candidatus Bipolaricaulota bacterium]
MSATAVIGAQWGDEAKGKVVHFLARDAQFTVRFNGGPNAGHTVKDGCGTVRLHHIPAGALHPGCLGVLAHGMALDPWKLRDELGELKAQGRPEPRLTYSDRVHLILPHHKLREELEGNAERIGTTRKGVGPCYEERAARRGLRLGDLGDEDTVRNALHTAAAELSVRGYRDAFPVEDTMRDLLEFYRCIGDRVGDVRAALNAALEQGKTVLFEGAQGTLLDLDWGTYPYVTSSTTTVHGVGWGTGIRSERLQSVLGVAKAYTTRVGEGPFPTEETGAVGKQLRELGGEYGSTTGRPRRCGWLDLVALRYACKVNGFTKLALTKMDVLGGLSELRLCVAYRTAEGYSEEFPASFRELATAVPVYERLPVWNSDLSGARSEDELPRPVRNLLAMVEAYVGIPVAMVGVGPADEEMVMLD